METNEHFMDDFPMKSEALLLPLKAVDDPFLSIAIPTYRRFDLLCETLESVFSLNFSFPVEILVIDNDSEQHELALKKMSKFSHENFSYYKNKKNLGMFGNWNQCLSLATGKYITILHDDDILLPEFAVQVNKWLVKDLKEFEIIAFSVGLLDLRTDRPEPDSPMAKKFLRTIKKFLPDLGCVKKSAVDFFFSNYFCGTLGVVMSRKLALSLHGFDKNWYPVADYEFWCRWVCHIGEINIINKKVGLYRIQQNESLRLDVRKSFVSGSTLIREKMISEKNVPFWFRYFISMIARIQEKGINLDWRSRSDADDFLFRLIFFPIWRRVVSVFCYFFRKT
jgi:glycosyltransferase involved in cell wall biosynthesis